MVEIDETNDDGHTENAIDDGAGFNLAVMSQKSEHCYQQESKDHHH